MLVNEGTDRFGSGEFLAAEGLDRPACIGETGAGELLGLLDRVEQSDIGVGALCQQSRTFQLECQPRERVGQDVMHFPGHACPFGGKGGCLLRLAAGLHLLEELRNAQPLLVFPPEQRADQEEERRTGVGREDQCESGMAGAELEDVERQGSPAGSQQPARAAADAGERMLPAGTGR